MSDSVIVTANGFPDPESLPLVSDVQYREPYSSAAINRKLRGLALPGIYSGFNPTPGTGLNVLIASGDDGGTCSFNIDKFYQLSVRQQSDVAVSMSAGTTKIIALQATYALGTETSQVNSGSTLQAAEFVVLDATAALADNQLEMCKVTIPADATQITSDMIDLSGRVARSLTVELSSAIDSDEEEVAANSLAVKNAIAHLENEIAEAISTKALTVSGAVSLLSTLSVGDAATFGNDVTATGNMMADRMRGASGIDIGYQSTTASTRQLNFYSGSDTTLTAYINAVGSTLAASYLTLKGGSITLIGATSVTGALSVSSSFTVSGSGAVSGTFSVGSNLYVTGQAQFSSSVITNTGLDIGYSNTTAGNRQVNFYSNGTTAVTAAIGVSGASTSTSSMTITAGTTTLTGSLSVTGAATLNSSLTVAGGGVFNGDVNVAGALYSTGAMRAYQYIDIGQQNGTAGGRQLSFYSTPGVVTGYIAVNGTAASSSSMTVSAGVVAVTTSATISGALSVGSSLTVSGSGAISGTLSVGSNLTVAGEVRSTTANNYRIVGGNYGVFQRFDGSNWYLMLTASGDQYGSYNSLRPMFINASTGAVTFGQAATFNSSLVTAGRLQSNSDILSSSVVYTGGGASWMAADANIYGSCWGGYLNTWISNNFKAASSYVSYAGIGAYVLARSSYGAALGPGSTISGSYLQASTADGGYVSDTLAGTWMLMGYMTTTNDAHRTSLYQRIA